MKNQKYKNTKKSKNGFRRRSRKHIKGGMRSEWNIAKVVETIGKKGEKDVYYIYTSTLYPNVHITYRDENNYHATIYDSSDRNNKIHIGHNIKTHKVGLWNTHNKQHQNLPGKDITKLGVAWTSFNNGLLTPLSIHEHGDGQVSTSRTPISQV